MRFARVLEDGKALAFRTAADVVYAGAVAMSYAEAVRYRIRNRVRAVLAETKDRPCVLCGAPMARTEDWGTIEWRRCSRCGQSVTGTPWSALVEG